MLKLFVVAASLAQAPPLETPPPPAEGWTPTLKLGATASYTDSRNVVGATEGVTAQLGVTLEAAANYRDGRHDWQNGFGAVHLRTRTPQLDRFVKSADLLTLKSLYVYRIEPWVGPYGQAKAEAPLLPGYEVLSEDVVVVRTFTSGRVRSRAREAGGTIPLTLALSPAVLTESAGIFVEPLTEKEAKLNAKLGFGAQQIFAQEGFAITDDATTPELELTMMRDSSQLGAVFEVGFASELHEMATFAAAASFFYPVYSSLETDLTGLEVMTSDLSAKLSVKVTKWLSLDYGLSAKRNPLMVDAWQVTNGVILTAGFGLP